MNIIAPRDFQPRVVDVMLGFRMVRYTLLQFEQQAAMYNATHSVKCAAIHVIDKWMSKLHFMPTDMIHSLNLMIGDVRIGRIGMDFRRHYVFIIFDTDDDGVRVEPNSDVFAWKLLFPVCSSNVTVIYTRLPIDDPNSFTVDGKPSKFILDAEQYGDTALFTSDRHRQNESNEEYLPDFIHEIAKRIRRLKEKGCC